MFKRLFCLVVFIGLVSVSRVSAQASVSPLWVTTLDSVWLWFADGTAPHMVVNQQANPLFSPDGKQVAFTLWAESDLDWATDEFNVPNEIWIADAITGKMTQIAAQPPDASEAKFLLYSTPSWSPDSTRLIWSQVSYPTYDESIVIYDLTSGKTTEFLKGLKAEGDLPRAQVDWSSSGIAVDKNVFHTDGSASDSETIFVYDEQGKLHSRVSLTDAHPGFSYGHVWMMDGEGEKIGVLYDDGSWLLIDPATGDTKPMTGQSELYSADKGVSLNFVLNADQQYEIWASQADAKPVQVGKLDYISQLFAAGTVAPDGKKAAFQAQDVASIWPDNTKIAVGGGDYSNSIINLNWGPTHWRVRPG